jgi:hypothetical protein
MIICQGLDSSNLCQEMALRFPPPLPVHANQGFSVVKKSQKGNINFGVLYMDREVFV